MTRLFLSITCFISMLSYGKAQPAYRSGDLLFQDLDCGELCDAIESVTTGYNGMHFSHIGLVFTRNDSVYVIEAIGRDVHLTPLAAFLSRSPKPVMHARLKRKYAGLVPDAVQYALRQLEVPYDDVFLYGNKKYYCSELIYDAFRAANHNTDVFILEPMTFRQPGSDQFFPVWVKYYSDLGIPIPEGRPGINPGGISRSGKIDIIE